MWLLGKILLSIPLFVASLLISIVLIVLVGTLVISIGYANGGDGLDLEEGTKSLKGVWFWIPKLWG